MLGVFITWTDNPGVNKSLMGTAQMGTTWYQQLAEHISQQGVTVDPATGLHFPHPWSFAPALQQGAACIAELGSLGVLQVSGEERKKFQQGQLSCDVAAVSPSHASLGTYCNLKGRAYCSFILTDDDSQSLLIMDQPLVETTQNLLHKYIVFSKAEMADQTARWQVLGLTGEDWKNRLQQSFSQIPETPFASAWEDHRAIIALPSEAHQPRWLMLADAEEPSAVLNLLDQTETWISENLWQLSEIRSGLAQITPALSEQFIPLELNFDQLNGVSFSKGCYTGQEIIARLHYRGKSKHQLFRVAGEADALPDPLDSVILEGKSVGQLVNTAWADANRFEALAILRDKACESAELTLKKFPNSPLKVSPISYAITNT